MSAVHGRLIRGRIDPSAAVREAVRIAAAYDNDAGALLLRAEADLVRQQAAAAMVVLAGLPLDVAGSSSVQLVKGRAAELLDDVVAAFTSYRLAAAEFPVAARRQQALAERTAEILSRRAADLLDRQRIDEAERSVAQLLELVPHAPATAELLWRLAVANGDAAAELTALRALVPIRPERVDLQIRRAVLEVEVGDARVGLEGLEAISARRPDDRLLAAELERAKFVFRLANAPEAVRSLAVRPRLSRAEFARLLFWFLPHLRRSTGGAAPIASDIVGHEAQEEIVRVIGVGLMRVDEQMHRFEPNRAVARVDALRALLIEPRSPGQALGCAGPARLGLADPCAAAVACGLLGEVAGCLPAAALTGREAVEWIRRSSLEDESER